MRRILGSHFVDVKRGPGNGSYVFDGVKPYIDCSKLDDTWPRLSNGEKLPPKVYFEDYTFDEKTRTFKAKVHFAPLLAGQADEWDLEQVFNEDFTAIVGGTVKLFKDGVFLHEEPYSLKEVKKIELTKYANNASL